jgi:hypothetical protein
MRNLVSVQFTPDHESQEIRESARRHPIKCLFLSRRNKAAKWVIPAVAHTESPPVGAAYSRSLPHQLFLHHVTAACRKHSRATARRRHARVHLQRDAHRGCNEPAAYMKEFQSPARSISAALRRRGRKSWEPARIAPAALPLDAGTSSSSARMALSALC